MSMDGEASSGSSTVHVILGMHRSGTSWLAGTLQQCGLDLGEVNEAAPYNRKGTRESEPVRSLHDAVLADAGGSWRDPPRRPTWSPAREAELQQLIEKMTARHSPWGFKDPRVLLLLDAWHRHVPEGLARVGIFRHPVAVAGSLHARAYDPLPIRDGIRLWRIYNSRLVREHQRDQFPLLRFDAAADGLLTAAADVAGWWHLPGGVDDGPQFFDEGLVTNRPEEPVSVPWSCRRLWSYLVGHAVN